MHVRRTRRETLVHESALKDLWPGSISNPLVGLRARSKVESDYARGLPVHLPMKALHDTTQS